MWFLKTSYIFFAFIKWLTFTVLSLRKQIFSSKNQKPYFLVKGPSRHKLRQGWLPNKNALKYSARGGRWGGGKQITAFSVYWLCQHNVWVRGLVLIWNHVDTGMNVLNFWRIRVCVCVYVWGCDCYPCWRTFLFMKSFWEAVKISQPRYLITTACFSWEKQLAT